MVLVEQLKSMFNKKLLIVSLLVVVGLIGYTVYLRQQKNESAAQEKQEISKLAQAVDAQRAELINYSIKRSQVQKKLLDHYKLMTEPVKTRLASSTQIQFLQQKDFNDYEYSQNYIQNLLAKRIIQDLNQKTKDKNIVEQIGELERLEKAFNEARINFSKKEIALSKKKNRAPVTFLSDVQILQ